MAGPPELPLAVSRRLSWQGVPGWEDDDHAAALAVLAASANPPHGGGTIRPAQPLPAALRGVIAKASAAGTVQDAVLARGFFETHFEPFSVDPLQGSGFLTAYFEPEYPASLRQTGHFSAPLLARPADLVTFPLGEAGPPPLDPVLTAARRTGSAFETFPTRADIARGMLAGQGLERAYLHPVDLFFMQVQGSGRLLFGDGSRARFAYAGRNGHPYTSIGKVIVAEGHMTLDGMTLEKLTGWLKHHPVEAQRILNLNKSYIFFERIDGLPETSGPIGGAGIPLTPHRSIAVDRSLWPYGLPFWLDVSLPQTLEHAEPVRRLMIAQDTGSAILGAARADYFMGTGAEAGRRAGLVRQPCSFIVLWPKESA